MLKFDCDLLRKNLTFCEEDPARSLRNTHFDDFKVAEALVERLWPDSGFQLKEEPSLEHFKGNKSIHLLFVSLRWLV